MMAPVEDSIAPAHQAVAANPSDQTSRAPSASASSGATSGYQYPRGEYFRSRRVKKGEIEKPWLKKKDPREKWVTIFPLLGLFIGLCITGVLIWDGVRSVAQHKYCTVLDENFSSWNNKIWTKEVEVGGYGLVT